MGAQARANHAVHANANADAYVDLRFDRGGSDVDVYSNMYDAIYDRDTSTETDTTSRTASRTATQTET